MLISQDKYDAVLFDMDGVLTMTMTLHAASWKKMFDDFLKECAQRTQKSFKPFTIAEDYKKYVDGRLRYDGVEAFLRSRGINLPYGNVDDAPSLETVCGLGNRKDLMVKEKIASGKIDLLDGALDVVHKVRSEGLKTAVVSASKNCSAILDAAKITTLFDCIIDGHAAAQGKFSGKPAPDTFLEAARQLGVKPSRAVVIEDAVSGVAAGKAGGFGLVVGIDHHGDRAALYSHGADLVIENLRELLQS